MTETNIKAQKEFEEDYRQSLFNKIDHLCSSQTTLLSAIKESKERLNNPIKRFSLIAKSFIALPPELDFSCTVEDIFELNGYALAYISLDNYIYDSDVKDIIIPSLVDHIKRTNFDKLVISEFLDNNIIPDLEKLGLSHLIPKLQAEVSKIYKDSKEESILDDEAR